MPARKRKAEGDGETTTSATTNMPGGPLWNLKPRDGDPILRWDLQADLLNDIFSDVHYRFTPPPYTDATIPLFPTDRTWSFAELYLDCLSNSTKATKNLKEKMGESTEYAVSFAKLCLLINIGRMNTTLAFYPEMKTVLRTYHSIPSMQLDDFTSRNLQDAPRMKAQLKGCCLPLEENNLPDSLEQVLQRRIELGWQPPTCAVQLLFLMFTQHIRLTTKYFPEGYTLHDLFLPANHAASIPSRLRSQAFLYLVHRFLEQPELAAADFADGLNKLSASQLLVLDRTDCSTENADTAEELAFGIRMKILREDFLEKYRAEESLAASSSNAKGGASPALLDRNPSTTSGLLVPGSLPKRVRAKVKVESRMSSPAPSTFTLNDDARSRSPTSVVATTPVLPAPEMAAAQVVPELPPFPRLTSAGVTALDVELRKQWQAAEEASPHHATSLLHLAWQKLRDDPMYESDEDESEWTARELYPKVLGFAFQDYADGARAGLCYDGLRPSVLSQHGIGHT